jgi:hypothetical protein
VKEIRLPGSLVDSWYLLQKVVCQLSFLRQSYRKFPLCSPNESHSDLGLLLGRLVVWSVGFNPCRRLPRGIFADPHWLCSTLPQVLPRWRNWGVAPASNNWRAGSPLSQGRASTTYLQLYLSQSQSQALLSPARLPIPRCHFPTFPADERVKMTFLSAFANHFLNNVKFYAFTVLVLGVALLVGQSVYAWYRLRHIKGPWHAGWSRLWLINSVASGNMHWKYAQVCEKYGTVDEA